MEPERAEGVVLRVQPVTETSLLVTWFTREFGKLKTLAKGARRPKSPMRGKIDLFYQDEIVFLRSRRSELHLLSDCYLQNAYRSVRESVAGLASASYACELIDALTEVEDPHGGMYDLLTGMLEKCALPARLVWLIWFELRVLSEAGWRPTFEGHGRSSKVLQSLERAQAAGVGRIRLTAEQAQDVWAVLRRFRGAHVERVLRSEKFVDYQFGR